MGRLERLEPLEPLERGGWREWDNASWARRGDTWEGWTFEERRIWRASREPIPDSDDSDLLTAEDAVPPAVQEEGRVIFGNRRRQ